MASKWINKSLFSEYVREKEEEKANVPQYENNRSALVWKNPDKGSSDTPNIYEGRLLPDPKGKFTRKYYYHMFKSGENWLFSLCPKTFDFSAWCPFCSITQKLYKGSASDKSMASNYKRKQKHITNFYVINDPRDEKISDDDQKSSNKVKLYEFPDKLESKITQETLDTAHDGAGDAIFDPVDGYNFIIKVKSTKASADGKIFPDYSDSVFARKATSLGDDEKVKAIMESTISLDDYLQGQIKSDMDIMSMLKSEMLWEMVEDEWKRYKGNVGVEEEKSQTFPTTANENGTDDDADDVPDFGSVPPVSEEASSVAEEDSDAALLAELENM